MHTNNGLPLVAPRVTPILDPAFRPRGPCRAGIPRSGELDVRGARADRARAGRRLRLPVRHERVAGVPSAGGRQCGSSRAVRKVSPLVARRLAHLCRRTGAAGGSACRALPRHRRRQVRRAPGGRTHVRPSAGGRAYARSAARTLRHKPLGRHLDGCRIGFDLGGSDRKVAAVIDGQAWSSAMRRSGTPTTSRIRSITTTASWTR